MLPLYLKKLLPRLGGVALILLTACVSGRSYEKKESADVAVEHILQSIDQAIDIAYARHGADLGLEITEVSVLLETVVDRSAGQDVTLSVVEIEATDEKSFTQSLTLTLDPPQKASGEAPTIARSAHPTLVKDLGEGIDAAILAARAAKQGLERLHPDGIPLETKKIKVAVSFSLTTTGEGLPSISILGISLTADRSKQRIHTITMSFEIKD